MTTTETTLSRAELMEQINALKAEQAALLAQAKTMPKAISFKVSEKGAMSVYGLGRFPVTLYAGQWRRVIAVIPELEQFLNDNEASLATKD